MKENILNFAHPVIKPRDWKCPCGKTYLSYAALFTHIKQKHGGKAPGEIIKPTKMKKLNHALQQVQKNFLFSSSDSEQKLDSEKTFSLKSTILEEEGKNQKYWDQFCQIFRIVPRGQKVKINVENFWEKLDSFSKFQSYVDNIAHSHASTKHCLGYQLAEFLQFISNNTIIEQFQSIFLLFMALLEYVMKENRSKNILIEAQAEILIEYINPFISNFIRLFEDQYYLSDCWILQKQNTNAVLMCFYNWLKFKNYTTFCITLIQ